MPYERGVAGTEMKILGTDSTKELLTRAKIMEIWQAYPEHNNKLCCPDCRGVLIEGTNTLECMNVACDNDDQYIIG